MPLNFLGLTVTYWNIDKGLPPPRLTAGCRGILSWYQRPLIKNSIAYYSWLLEQTRQGCQLVVLGELGTASPTTAAEKKASADVYRLLGIEDLDFIGDNPALVTITRKQPAMVEYERKLQPGYYHKYRALAEATSYLTLDYSGPGGGNSDVVVIGSRGGFALQGCVLYRGSGLTQWYLNPFAFFTRAFACRDLPCPDSCLLNGNRIFLCSIDGDGFCNVSEFDGKSHSGVIITREILACYRLPSSVSLVIGEIAPEALGVSKDPR